MYCNQSHYIFKLKKKNAVRASADIGAWIMRLKYIFLFSTQRKNIDHFSDNNE